MSNIIKAPTPADQITGVEYVIMGRKTTVCLLTLKNGFEIVGTSACINPGMFDVDTGRKLAYANAYSKLEEFEGYRAHVEVVR